MSIESPNGNFSVVQLRSSDVNAPKADISLSNGVNIYSIPTVVIAGSSTTLPNRSLFIDSNGVLGVVKDGALKPFQIV